VGSRGYTLTSFATVWLSTPLIKGADIGTIQTLLGHKTAAMARCYAGQALDRQSVCS
jgi:site-specific recombinase XerD